MLLEANADVEAVEKVRWSIGALEKQYELLRTGIRASVLRSYRARRV